MFYGLKYHLITIIALFIALTIGILIGSTIIGSESIMQQQQKLIGALKKDFRALRSENDRFKRQIKSLEEKLALNLEYRRNILSLLFKDRLNEEKILVVRSNKIGEKKINRVIDYLKLANPKVIDSLNEEQVVKDRYTKIIFLGKINGQLKEEYTTSLTDVIELSQHDIDSFPDTIEKILDLVLSSKLSLERNKKAVE